MVPGGLKASCELGKRLLVALEVMERSVREQCPKHIKATLALISTGRTSVHQFCLCDKQLAPLTSPVSSSQQHCEMLQPFVSGCFGWQSAAIPKAPLSKQASASELRMRCAPELTFESCRS